MERSTRDLYLIFDMFPHLKIKTLLEKYTLLNPL